MIVYKGIRLAAVDGQGAVRKGHVEHTADLVAARQLRALIIEVFRF